MFELDAPRAERLYQALDRLSAVDETHICVPFFSQDEIALMAEQAKTLDFRAATAVVGKGCSSRYESLFSCAAHSLF